MPKILKNNIIALIILAVTLVLGITIGVVATNLKNIEFSVGVKYDPAFDVKLEIFQSGTNNSLEIFNTQKGGITDGATLYIHKIYNNTMLLSGKNLKNSLGSNLELKITNLNTNKKLYYNVTTDTTTSANINESLSSSAIAFNLDGDLGYSFIEIDIFENTIKSISFDSSNVFSEIDTKTYTSFNAWNNANTIKVTANYEYGGITRDLAESECTFTFTGTWQAGNSGTITATLNSNVSGYAITCTKSTTMSLKTDTVLINVTYTTNYTFYCTYKTITHTVTGNEVKPFDDNGYILDSDDSEFNTTTSGNVKTYTAERGRNITFCSPSANGVSGDIKQTHTTINGVNIITDTVYILTFVIPESYSENTLSFTMTVTKSGGGL